MQAEITQAQFTHTMRGVSVLHVVASAGRYGAEAVIAALCREQHALGLHVHVAIISDNLAATAPYARELQHQSHANVTVIEGKGIRDLLLSKRIADIARKAGAAIIHSHGYKSDILCSRVRLPNVRRVSTLHGWTNVKTWSRMACYQKMQIRSLRVFDCVVAVDETVWGQHPSLSKLKHRAVITNGIPPSNSRDTIPHFGWFSGVDVPVILVIGRLSQEKGQDIALQAMHLLKQRGVPGKMVLAGDGPDFDTLRRRIIDSGLEDRVAIPGYVTDVSALMKLATVLLIPSFREGLPIILLEAMREGIPVVATRVGGMPAAIGYGSAGKLVDAGDVVGMASALEHLLADSTLRAKLAHTAREVYKSRYTSIQMAQHYLRLYEGKSSLDEFVLQSRQQHIE